MLRRMKEDNGNASIILGIILIIAIMVVGAILLDVSKAYQLKSSYVDTAKKATQAAVMEQSTEGYLNPEAAGEAVRVYENIRGSVVNRNGYFSSCKNDDVEYKVTFLSEDGKKSRVMGTIKRSQIALNGNGETIESAKAIATKMGALSNANVNAVRSEKYKSVQLTLVEGTENVMLPGVFGLAKADKNSIEGIKCQKMTISERANIFIGEKDGIYN